MKTTKTRDYISPEINVERLLGNDFMLFSNEVWDVVEEAPDFYGQGKKFRGDAL